MIFMKIDKDSLVEICIRIFLILFHTVFNRCITLHLYQIGQYNVCVLCIKVKPLQTETF